MRSTCFTAIASILPALASYSTSHAATIDEQRAAFRLAHAAAERGEWQPSADNAAILHSYVLWPDLRAAYLRTQLGKDNRAVLEFLQRYGRLKPARELRYRYALELAQSDRYADYLALYTEHYRELGEPSLDCLAAFAKIQLGQRNDAMSLATELWLTGRSQVKQCDPLFSTLQKAGLLTKRLHAQRYALAVDAQEFILARYLARSLDAGTLTEANRWLRAQGNPAQFLQLADVSNRDSTYREQLAYAARRLGFSKPLDARRHWRRLARDLRFAASLEADVTRHVALWAARLQLPEARQLLDSLSPAAVDEEVRRWRIRTALRAEDWQQVVLLVEQLSTAERDQEEWRYWHGVALERTGNHAEGMLVLSGLARERSYYGFLAADQLDIDYAYHDSSVAADEAAIDRLGSRPEIIRARELFHVGLESRARSEWDAALRSLNDDDRIQAAVLAHRWNWHSRAIAAAAQSGEYDDLDLRYPLPHRDAFRHSANETGVRESWAYGVARSESLFMRDVRSSAGAIGLMQLMPSTGRDTAREIKHPYRGRNTLTDPSSNIRLGTQYLAKMHKRFDRHPALATAAYNAGPRRVDNWVQGKGPMDARIWIENIPFNETRRYVRRVLASDVIFHWRLTGKTSRLSEQLPRIAP